MKISECKVLMAYALGRIACEKEEEKTRFKLKEINPEWDHYELVGRGYDKSNNSYSLYYEGNVKDTFGKEKFYFKILGIPEGWNLKHMTSLIIAAIEMHKAEIKEKEEE